MRQVGIAALIVVGLLLGACAGTAPQATQGPSGNPPRQTSPTNTARPQPTPTHRPRPTSTPSPLDLPEEVRLALSNVRILSQDDRLSEGYAQASASNMNGLTTITASGDWEGYWGPTETHRQGRAALLLFKFEEGAVFVISHWVGEFGTKSFMEWGVAEDGSFGLVDRGEYLPRVPFSKVLSFEPDTWYYALFAIDPGGRHLMLVWEKDGHYITLSRSGRTQDWGNPDWNFRVALGDGTFVVDRFDTYSFDEIRMAKNTGDWGGKWWFWGITEDTYLIDLKQEDSALTSNFTINDGRTFRIRGTVYDWTSPQGETSSVMRGNYWIESEDNPDVYGYIWADWRLDPSRRTIFASGHGGASQQCLIRSNVEAFPEDCLWYYYDINQGMPADW